MRIVSLIPSATEILFAVGAGDDVVGVTFECDHPPAARERRVVSTSAMPEGLGPKEIDDFVAAALAAGKDLYRLDADALAELDADLVVTQDLCAVCAVDVGTVDEALGLPRVPRGGGDDRPAHPRRRAGVDHRAGANHRARRAGDRAGDASSRHASRPSPRRVAGLDRPRVLVLEWTDPPFAPGHWIPEMVARAGGEPTLGVAGTRSSRITWDDAVASEPDVVVCAPCGFDLEGGVTLAKEVRDRFPGVPVWAVDADGHFARPGPRLVDGVEALAGILHPRAVAPSAHARQV